MLFVNLNINEEDMGRVIKFKVFSPLGGGRTSAFKIQIQRTTPFHCKKNKSNNKNGFTIIIKWLTVYTADMVMMMKKAAVGLMFASLAHVAHGFSSQSAHSTKNGVRGGGLKSMPPQSGSAGVGGERNPYLDRHASDYIEDLRNKRSDDSNGRSYSANNPPGGWTDVPNAGSTASQPRARGVDPNVRGLGALASGVSTPMDKYNYDGPRSRPMPREPRRPPGPNSRFNDGPDSRFDDGQYEGFGPMETMSARGPPPIDPNEMRALQEEVERLQKENAMLKRSCGDLLNNFNELSNRLFDVDETLKKVANIFPSEDEMESLAWLLKK